MVRVILALVLLFFPAAQAVEEETKYCDLYSMVQCHRYENVCTNLETTDTEIHTEEREKHFGYLLNESSAKVDLYFNGAHIFQVRDYNGVMQTEGVSYDYKGVHIFQTRGVDGGVSTEGVSFEHKF